MISLASAGRSHPRATALVTGDRALSFAELAELASTRHAGQGELVAVRGENRVEVVATLLSLLDAGRAFLPVHPRATETESTRLMNLFGATSLLVGDAGDAAPPASRAPDDLACVLATSGTTGTPKGAELTLGALAAAAAASEQNLGFTPGDRWILCLPICHVGGLSVLTRCLAARVPVDLVERFDPEVVLSRVRAGGTMLSVVPTMLRALLDEDRANDLAKTRVVLVGGAATDPALLATARARGVPALTTYGLTEACSQVASQSPSDPVEARVGSGRPLSCVSVRIARSGGATAEPGEEGEITLAGRSMMRGYRGAPPLGGAWFHTGDLGSVDARGNLHVIVRRTDLIVTGGENVYPVEVERALETLPTVRSALVVGVPDDRWGHVVGALVVPRGDASAQGIRDALRSTLASFKIPKRVVLVDALPTLPSGKPDRRGAATLLR